MPNIKNYNDAVLVFFLLIFIVKFEMGNKLMPDFYCFESDFRYSLFQLTYAVVFDIIWWFLRNSSS